MNCHWFSWCEALRKPVNANRDGHFEEGDTDIVFVLFCCVRLCVYKCPEHQVSSAESKD